MRGVRPGTAANASLMFPIHHSLGIFPAAQNLIVHGASDDLLSSRSFCSIVSSHVLIRLRCFFLEEASKEYLS
jgi:hypothetical protein